MATRKWAEEVTNHKEYMLPGGLPIQLPAGDTISEALEEVPAWMWPAIWKHNKKVYGEK